jgi:FMN reductase
VSDAHTNDRPPFSGPYIVGIGGASRAGSTSERVLALALAAAEAKGARTDLFGGEHLAKLPLFNPEVAAASPERDALNAAVRAADGLIIASPGYHGSVSGLVKNALDSLEMLRDDPRPYFDGRAVGVIVTVDGWQAAGATLGALRAIVHALRGWNTPIGVALNAAAARDTGGLFDGEGRLADRRDAWQVQTMAEQVVAFANLWRAGC